MFSVLRCQCYATFNFQPGNLKLSAIHKMGKLLDVVLAPDQRNPLTSVLLFSG